MHSHPKFQQAMPNSTVFCCNSKEEALEGRCLLSTYTQIGIQGLLSEAYFGKSLDIEGCPDTCPPSWKPSRSAAGPVLQATTVNLLNKPTGDTTLGPQDCKTTLLSTMADLTLWLSLGFSSPRLFYFKWRHLFELKAHRFTPNIGPKARRHVDERGRFVASRLQGSERQGLQGFKTIKPWSFDGSQSNTYQS